MAHTHFVPPKAALPWLLAEVPPPEIESQLGRNLNVFSAVYILYNMHLLEFTRCHRTNRFPRLCGLLAVNLHGLAHGEVVLRWPKALAVQVIECYGEKGLKAEA